MSNVVPQADGYCCTRGNSVLLLEVYAHGGQVFYANERGDGSDPDDEMRIGNSGFARAYIWGRARDLKRAGYTVVALKAL